MYCVSFKKSLPECENVLRTSLFISSKKNVHLKPTQQKKIIWQPQKFELFTKKFFKPSQAMHHS